MSGTSREHDARYEGRAEVSRYGTRMFQCARLKNKRLRYTVQQNGSLPCLAGGAGATTGGKQRPPGIMWVSVPWNGTTCVAFYLLQIIPKYTT